MAVVVWAGGMISFSLVVMPALRGSLPPPQRQALIRTIGRRYRAVGWASVAVLLATGPVMAWQRGVVWDSAFGRILSVKLALVGVMLILTVLHDFVLGPRAASADAARKEGPRRAIVWLARVNLLVVLGIMVCGVWLTLT